MTPMELDEMRKDRSFESLSRKGSQNQEGWHVREIDHELLARVTKFGSATKHLKSDCLLCLSK